MEQTIRTDEEKKAIKNRISRISGQLTGIVKMVDEDRYCGDILMQLAAITNATKSLATLIMEKHLKGCVLKKMNNSNEAVIDEVVELFKRF